MQHPLCILFALARESRPFLGYFPSKQRIRGGPVPAWQSDDTRDAALIVESGIGPDRAASALCWLLRGFVPSAIVSAGFAGALSCDLGVGDILLADSVVDRERNVWPASWPDTPKRSGFRVARILSMPNVVGCPSEKRRLGDQFGAAAVDMESATVARISTERGITFGCLRVISDDAGTSLSKDMLDIVAGGSVSWVRLAHSVVRRPRVIPELARLARHTRHAGERLAMALLGMSDRNGSKE